MPIIVLDNKITTTLRLWGKRHYAFWNFFAGQGMYGYVAVMTFFIVTGQLIWWQAIVTVLASYVALMITQAMVRRQRPAALKTTGYKMWFKTYSWPSGHSTESACLATSILLMTQFQDSTQMTIAALILVPLTLAIGFSRIVVGAHYASDVFFGLLLGTAFGFVYASVLV